MTEPLVDLTPFLQDATLVDEPLDLSHLGATVVTPFMIHWSAESTTLPKYELWFVGRRLPRLAKKALRKLHRGVVLGRREHAALWRVRFKRRIKS